MKIKLFTLVFFIPSIFTPVLSQTVNEFIVNVNNERIIFKSGMSKPDIENLLGTNYIEQPDKEINCERWIYYKITDEKKNVKIRFKNELLQNVMLLQDTIVPVEQDTVTSTGMIIKRPLVTKSGKESPCCEDYYLKTANEELFIKLSESKIPVDSLSKYIDKPVILKYLTRNGEWDSNEKQLTQNRIQSRIGKYIIVLELNEN